MWIRLLDTGDCVQCPLCLPCGERGEQLGGEKGRRRLYSVLWFWRFFFPSICFVTCSRSVNAAFGSPFFGTDGSSMVRGRGREDTMDRQIHQRHTHQRRKRGKPTIKKQGKRTRSHCAEWCIFPKKKKKKSYCCLFFRLRYVLCDGHKRKNNIQVGKAMDQAALTVVVKLLRLALGNVCTNPFATMTSSRRRVQVRMYTWYPGPEQIGSQVNW